jgi:hypothetical protein
VSFRIQQPVLNHRAQTRAEAHYGNMLGMPCYLANSAITEVGYRGDNFRAASTQQMRVVVRKLLLQLKSFPKRLTGLPVGALYYSHGVRVQVHISQDHPEDCRWRLSVRQHSRI